MSIKEKKEYRKPKRTKQREEKTMGEKTTGRAKPKGEKAAKASVRKRSKQVREEEKPEKKLKMSPPILPTIKAVVHRTFNLSRKIRVGYGFSIREIQAAGIDVTKARKLGIYVDTRRRSAHSENTEALKAALTKAGVS
jgi:ribosomal protein L13E